MHISDFSPKKKNDCVKGHELCLDSLYILPNYFPYWLNNKPPTPNILYEWLFFCTLAKTEYYHF